MSGENGEGVNFIGGSLTPLHILEGVGDKNGLGDTLGRGSGGNGWVWGYG